MLYTPSSMVQLYVPPRYPHLTMSFPVAGVGTLLSGACALKLHDRTNHRYKTLPRRHTKKNTQTLFPRVASIPTTSTAVCCVPWDRKQSPARLGWIRRRPPQYSKARRSLLINTTFQPNGIRFEIYVASLSLSLKKKKKKKKERKNTAFPPNNQAHGTQQNSSTRRSNGPGHHSPSPSELWVNVCSCTASTPSRPSRRAGKWQRQFAGRGHMV